MPIASGWANNSGNELFTIGWVLEDTFKDITCLPIIGLDWITSCTVQHYTWSWICCDDTGIPRPPGGGGGKGKGKGKGKGHDKEYDHEIEYILPTDFEPRIQQALREDEELLLLVEAWLIAANKH